MNLNDHNQHHHIYIYIDPHVLACLFPLLFAADSGGVLTCLGMFVFVTARQI